MGGGFVWSDSAYEGSQELNVEMENGFDDGFLSLAPSANLQVEVVNLLPSCAASISPTQVSVPADGGSGTVTVNNNNIVCPLSVGAPSASWLTVGSPNPNYGSGTVAYSVGPSTIGRTATVNIAGKTFTVSQRPQGSMTLLDPVPTLLISSGGSPILGNSTAMAALAPSARVVQGVASDGVTQLVVDISGALPGENLSLAIIDGEPASGEGGQASGDGGLASLGSNVFQGSPLTFQADSNGNAFALYRAPVDFVNALSDSTTAYRTLDLHLSSNDDPTFLADSQITVVRPMVMLIHGLWSSSVGTWDNFTPLVGDPRFEIVDGDYSSLPYPVLGSIPYYDPMTLNLFLKGSALGLNYSTPLVLQQLQDDLQAFRTGTNPAGIPVAAIQADIVAHSMGGLVARNLAHQDGYLNPKNYGTGLIHKMITIDTPHWGSPLAIDLLDPDNLCVANVMALGRNVAVQEVTTLSGTFSGAVGDLQGTGNGVLPLMSPALQTLYTSNLTQIPVAMISAKTTNANLSSLPGGLGGLLISNLCNNLLMGVFT